MSAKFIVKMALSYVHCSCGDFFLPKGQMH